MKTNNEIRAWKENGNPNQYEKMLGEYSRDLGKWNKKHENSQVDGVVLMPINDLQPVAPSRVSYGKDGINLHVYGLDGSYTIEWKKINDDADNISAWVYHLCGKTWCDRRLVRDFVECVFDHFGKDIHTIRLG